MSSPGQMGVDLRAKQADQFGATQLSDFNPDIYKNNFIADVIQTDLNNEDTPAILLGSGVVTQTAETDLPIAWRIATPHVFPGMLAHVEFDSLESQGLAKVKPQLASSDSMERALQHYAREHAAYDQLFYIIGHQVVEHVRGEGKPVFAALERMMRIDDNSFTIWNRLIFSPEVFTAAHYIHEYIENSRNNGMEVPGWIEEIYCTTHPSVLAVLLAVSALKSAKESHNLAIDPNWE